MNRFRIVLTRSDGSVATFEPDGDVARIGRGTGCDIRLDEPLLALDHARLIFEEDACVLVDSGTGEALSIEEGGHFRALIPNERLRLSPGVVIGVGPLERRVKLRVERAGDEEPPQVVELRPMAQLLSPPSVRGDSASVLRALCDVQRSIGAAKSLDEVLAAVLDATLTLVPRATHATLVLRDEAASGVDEGAYVPVLTRVRGQSGDGARATEPVRVARSVFRKVVRERAAVLAADAPSGELVSESLLGASIRSTIGVPLWKGEQIVGVLQLDNRAAPGMFTSADVDAVAVLAANASLAVANARLIHRLERAEESLQRENRFLRGRDRARRGGAAEIVGQSRAISELKTAISKVAGTRVSVLIEGETGSGKELVAAAVHDGSRRRDRLFVAQNCAALPESLLESELFGHKRGAFTGATEDRKGLFELADGGTLFLDEVTEMPLSLQAKLLRVLQEGEVRPVGAAQPKQVDVRIVAATNRHIEAEVSAGRFREDLYYRLKVFPLHVPALRERRDDIPLLAGHFLKKYSSEMGKAVAGYTEASMDLLTAYEWPGNVRELENEVQRLVIQADTGGFLGPELLSAKIRKAEGTLASAGPAEGTLKEMMDNVERHLVLETLKKHDHNKTQAAKALGITREGLHKKLRLLGIG